MDDASDDLCADNSSRTDHHRSSGRGRLEVHACGKL
jgi:hypothetical protein